MFRPLQQSRFALLAPLSAVVLAGCGGSSSPPAAQAAAASPASAASAAAAASPSPAGVDQTIRITYANGKVSGVGGRVKVRLKSVVSLVVTSDVADEIHLHGYDKHVDVPKNGTATLTFTANLPGVFEVELESLKHRLVLLQVQ